MKKKTKICIIGAVVGLGICHTITSFARYSTNKVWDYYLKSQGFYLSSDNLSNNQKNVNTLWDGNSIKFNIKNSINNNLITDYDINYSVTCEILDENIDATCSINGTKNSYITGVLSNNSKCINNLNDSKDVSKFTKSECELNNYVWVQQPVNEELYFDIIPNESYEIKNVNLLITVTSLSPYKKTLTGIYNLYKNEIDEGSINKQTIKKDNYNLLVITNTYDTNKCVSVNFESDTLALDVNSKYKEFTQDENGYIKEFKINLDSKTSEKIIFYTKKANVNFDNLQFDVSLSSGCS